MNDVYRRYVAFIEPPPSMLATGVAVEPARGASCSAAAVGAPAGGVLGGPPFVGVAAPAGLEPWRGVLRRVVPGLRLFRARRTRGWTGMSGGFSGSSGSCGGPEAGRSSRASEGAGGFTPRIVRAAVAQASGLLADTMVDCSALLIDVRNSEPLASALRPSPLPRSLAKLRLERRAFCRPSSLRLSGSSSPMFMRKFRGIRG